MKIKDLKINFRYLGGNIACLSVDSIGGESVHNDINDEEAIIIFNSLVGEKENCQTVKTLLKENQELKKQLEDKEDFILSKKLQATKDRLDKYNYKITMQQQEFIKYLEDEKDRLASACSNIYEDGLGHTRLVNEDKFDEVNDILQKYKEIIGLSDEKEN